MPVPAKGWRMTFGVMGGLGSKEYCYEMTGCDGSNLVLNTALTVYRWLLPYGHPVGWSSGHPNIYQCLPCFNQALPVFSNTWAALNMPNPLWISFLQEKPPIDDPLEDDWLKLASYRGSVPTSWGLERT